MESPITAKQDCPRRKCNRDLQNSDKGGVKQIQTLTGLTDLRNVGLSLHCQTRPNYQPQCLGFHH